MHKTPFFQVCQWVQKRPKWGAALGDGLSLPCQLFKAWDPAAGSPYINISCLSSSAVLGFFFGSILFSANVISKYTCWFAKIQRRKTYAYVNCMFFCCVIVQTIQGNHESWRGQLHKCASLCLL